MPGISGIISTICHEANEEDLGLMVKCMMHEPHYRTGSYINTDIGLYVGWTSHEGSFSDCNPIFNERRDLALIFSGEVFSEAGVVDGLKCRGHDFDRSNAGYLVHLYEEEGDDFFKRLNGWFFGVLVDLRKGNIILFNDRYGMERIYYHEGTDGFLFSSEAKSILKIRRGLRNVDPESLGEFFAFNCVMKNRSLFKDIFLLPGGSRWSFKKSGTFRRTSYFVPADWENQTPLEKSVFLTRVSETFRRKLPQYLEASQPVALSLTSGLDSRAIIANLEIPAKKMLCYTYSGDYRESYDARIARKVADACGQVHATIRLGDDFLSRFPECAEKTIYLSDGSQDVLGAHDYFLSALSRQIAPIRLTGKFGSEVLLNHSSLRNPIAYSSDYFHPDFSKFTKRAVETLVDLRSENELSFALFREIPWYEHNRLSIELSQLTVRTPYMDNDLVELMYRGPANVRSNREIRLRLVADGNAKLRGIMTDRGTAGDLNHVLSSVVQLLCYAVFKSEYIYLFQLPGWMAKIDSKVAGLHPERFLVGRYQYLPYRIWFRDRLAEYLQEIFTDTRTASRPFINRAFLRNMLYKNISGDANYTNEINKTLTVELIYRRLIDDI